MRTSMNLYSGNLNTGKLCAALLFVSLTAGSALAQIPSVVQPAQDAKASSAKAPAAKPAAATGAKPAVATATKPAAAPAAAKPTTVAAQKSPASSAAPKPAVAAAKPAVAVVAPAKTATAAKAPVPAKHDPFAKSAVAKSAVAKAAPKPGQPTAVVTKSLAPKSAAANPSETASTDSPAESKEDAAEKKKESGYITAGNRRDPFVSPIVQHIGGSGCSTGKRCLAIDQIALRGIVKSDSGMIAVVVNSLDKAYFLRENDPVFNGYVLKISGDSVVFKETVQDKLGHLSTREVVKKITTPAV